MIGFVAHGLREGAVSLAEDTVRWLRGEGHAATLLDASARGAGPDGEAAARLDLAVSLGGDGTMLRTVDMVSPEGVPVLGVNFGHLGYLTAVEPEGLRPALQRFLAGDFRLEQRMTLDVSVINHLGDGSSTVLHRCALNDVVLQRPTGGHTVRAQVLINDVPFLAFSSDSLILATPTGSTAYNLSARGPIVSPRARVLIVTPVAPHGLFDRSLVLNADDVVSLVPTGGMTADVVVDGWVAAALAPGQTLRCRKGDRDAVLVTFGERDFHSILKRKFDLTDG